MASNLTSITKLVTFSNQLEERMEFFVNNRASIFFKNKKSSDIHNNLILLEKAWEITSERFYELQKYLEEFESIEELEKVG